MAASSQRLRELAYELLAMADAMDSDSEPVQQQPPPPPPLPSGGPEAALAFHDLWTHQSPCGDVKWHNNMSKQRRAKENIVYVFFAAVDEECETCVSCLLEKRMSPMVQSDSGQYDAMDFATWVRDKRNETGDTPIMTLLKDAAHKEAQMEEQNAAAREVFKQNDPAQQQAEGKE